MAIFPMIFPLPALALLLQAAEMKRRNRYLPATSVRLGAETWIVRSSPDGLRCTRQPDSDAQRLAAARLEPTQRRIESLKRTARRELDQRAWDYHARSKEKSAAIAELKTLEPEYKRLQRVAAGGDPSESWEWQWADVPLEEPWLAVPGDGESLAPADGIPVDTVVVRVEAVEEAKAALRGAIEVMGDVANLGHALNLLEGDPYLEQPEHVREFIDMLGRGAIALGDRLVDGEVVPGPESDGGGEGESADSGAAPAPSEPSPGDPANGEASDGEGATPSAPEPAEGKKPKKGKGE